jgi:uncharacterized protein (DUF1697 family)
MTRYVALLRAVNITTRPLKMERLRALLAELGLANVSTYIASGNALFDADETAGALEARIEAHLHAALGFEVATFLRTDRQMTAIAAYQPFDAADTAAAFGLMVMFLKSPPDAAQTAKLMTYRRAGDDFAVHEREVYWLRRTQQSETNFSAATLERILRAPGTMRNSTTVRKLAALVGQP